MQIRHARPDDISSILQLVAEVVPLMNAGGNLQWDANYPNREIFTEDIRHDKLWVAEVDGQIAGVSAITTDQDPEYAEVGWDLSETAIVTHRLAVSPRFHGRGIAAALLHQAELEALRRGIARLRIDTNSENAATQQLFPKMGYVFAGEIGLKYRPGLRFYCYEKRLDT